MTNPAFPTDRGDFREMRERSDRKTDRDTKKKTAEKERGSAMSLSVPHIGSGTPTLSAVRYTTAERSTVSFSFACCLAAGRMRDE